MAMAAAAGSALRASIRQRTVILVPKKSFASSAHHNDAYEAAKWEKITYAGIITSAFLGAYSLSKGTHHTEQPPAYSYLHIRNKEFPWGPNGLFERKD